MRFPLHLRILLAVAAAATCLPVGAVVRSAEAQAVARVWVESARDQYRRGDRLPVRFSVDRDAYAAVIHIDPDGNIDFLHPAGPRDEHFVRGGRVYGPSAHGAASWVVRGRPGIGYLYLVASPTPLDFSLFRGAGLSLWDWGYAGRTVRGDPFLAFEQITRALLPRGGFSRHVADYYGYQVEGVHRYPSYACSHSRMIASTGFGWGWTPSYGSCDRQESFLRRNPYYYDTRRFRGDRRTYWGEYDSLDPRHGFKEAPDRPARATTPATPRGSGGGGAASQGEVQRREPARPAPSRGGARDRGGRAEPEAGRGEEPRPRPTPDAPPEPSRRRPSPESETGSPAPSREPASTAPGRRPATGTR